MPHNGQHGHMGEGLAAGGGAGLGAAAAARHHNNQSQCVLDPRAALMPVQTCSDLQEGLGCVDRGCM